MKQQVSKQQVLKQQTVILTFLLTLYVGVAYYGQIFKVFTTEDPPVMILDNTGTFSACQTISVPGGTGPVSALMSVEVTAEHTWVGDLAFEVTSPASSTLTILNRPGRSGFGSGNSDDLELATPILYFDLAASGTSAEDMGDACPGVIDGSPGCVDNYFPAPDASDTPFIGQGIALSDFFGEPAAGIWTLCAGDAAGGDTGTLSSWRLSVSAPIPVELESFSIE